MFGVMDYVCCINDVCDIGDGDSDVGDFCTLPGECRGAESQMMTDIQWQWLEVKITIV